MSRGETPVPPVVKMSDAMESSAQSLIAARLLPRSSGTDCGRHYRPIQLRASALKRRTGQICASTRSRRIADSQNSDTSYFYETFAGKCPISRPSSPQWISRISIALSSAFVMS